MLFVAGRVANAALLAMAVATIVFLTLHLVPGDPAELLLSTGGITPIPPPSRSCASASASTGRSSSNMSPISAIWRAAILASRSWTTIRSRPRLRSACRARWS